MTTSVTSTTNGTSTTSNGSSSSNALSGLTMNDFLTLMTAQLQNQDPLDPTDSNEFLSQLSELSEVEGISQLNTNLSSLSGSLLETQAVNSAGLVGETVLAAASSGALASGGTLSGAVNVPSGTSAVTLAITNSAGETVDTISLPTTEGMQSFSWDGTTSSGATAPAGTYTVTATATVNGSSESPTTYLNGTVSSVTLDSSTSSVTLNTPQLGSVSLSNVEQID